MACPYRARNAGGLVVVDQKRLDMNASFPVTSRKEAQEK